LALEYYISAVEASKNLKDLFTVASAELSLGDFYYNRRENKLALQEYLDVLEIAEKHFSPQNKARVEMRINDLKVKMGEQAFNLALQELKKGENN
jgi:tetratricopeptide (TPR) repeat protein